MAYYSVNLIDWHPDTGATQVAVSAPSNGVETVTIQLSATATGAATAAGGKLFLRLKTGADPFTAWIGGLDWSGFTNPDLTVSGDPDHDGRSNFDEWAFALDPRSGASSNPFASTAELGRGKFQYTRRTGTGLTYKVWYSVNLVNWFADVPASHVLGGTSGEVETWSVELSATAMAAAADGRLFVRVQAE